MNADFTIILAGCGFFLLVLACFGWSQPRIALAIEHWGKPIQGLNEPADLFYARLYQRLKEHLTDAGLPDSKIGFGPGNLFGNRTIFGARPEYLIVRYSHLTIYIYAFRLPSGLYVSYWAFSKYTLLLEHKILKWLVFWRDFQMTLYQFDVTDMCLTTINGTIHEVIAEYCAERGLKPLEEFERRPILQSFYAKYKQGNQPPYGYAGQPPVYMMPVPTSMPTPLQTPAPAVPSRPPVAPPEAPPNAAPSEA